MALIRSIAYVLVFYFGSVPIVVVAGFAALIGPEALWHVSKFWSQFHAWCVRHLLGIRVVVVGKFPDRGVIIAMKHESAFETIEILRLMDRPAVVMKAELFKIPVWGWVAKRHGSIPVARETGSGALRRMLRAANAAVAQNRPVVIFPEGTRVAHGQTPPLRPGIAGLYKTLGIPVVPVAIDSGRLWPRRKLVKHAGTITIEVSNEIPIGLSRDEIESRIHTGINVLNQ